MLTGASEKIIEKVAFDLSHEETVGVFYVEESGWGCGGWDTPRREPACSEAWRLESVACLESRK